MDLPKGWAKCRLSDVNLVIAGQSPESKYYNQDGDGLPFFQGKTDFGQLYPTNRVYCTAPKKLAESGDILLSVRAPVGPTNLARETVAIGRGLSAIRPLGGISTRYVLNFFKHIEPVFSGQGTGTTFSAVTVDDVKNLDFLLPPLTEQNRIVAKIDALFSELDKGVELLQTICQQLRTYRQAVLKWAFEGKDWERVTIEKFLSKNRKPMATGPFGTMLKKHEHKQTGVPVLGIENIERGIFQQCNKIFVSPEKAEELKAFELHTNDVIISRSGTVGELCLVPEHMNGALLSTNLMRVTLDENEIMPRYFVYLFLSKGIVIDQVKELCKGSTRDFLNQTILKQIIFPLPPLVDQSQIVAEIESRLSVCDKLEQIVDENLNKAQALKQSILKKAFAGQLVPQDPDDESASVLLECIKAEQKSSDTKAKTKGGRKNG